MLVLQIKSLSEIKDQSLYHCAGEALNYKLLDLSHSTGKYFRYLTVFRSWSCKSPMTRKGFILKEIQKKSENESNFTHSAVFPCILSVSMNPLPNLLFRCCDDPMLINSPLTMIAKRVHKVSHSSMLCDVKIMVFPKLRTFNTCSQRLRFAAGSMPVVGSSKVCQNIVKKYNIEITNRKVRKNVGCMSNRSGSNFFGTLLLYDEVIIT